MLVLRLTTPAGTQEVRTPRTDLVLGSDPAGDVALPGLAPQALRLTQIGSEVQVEDLATTRRLTIRVGDAIEIGGVEVALVGLLPPERPADLPVFGAYEDDPVVERAAPPPFELAAAPPAWSVAAPAGSATARAAPAPPPPAPSSQAPSSQASVPRADAPVGRASPPATPASAPAPTETPETPETQPDGKPKIKPRMFPEPDFGAELVSQLKRTPFFAVSLAVHLLIFFILSLIDSTEGRRPLREGPGAVTASMSAEREELGPEHSDLEDDGIPMPEAPLPDLSALEPPDETPEPPKAEPPSPFAREMRDLEREPPQPLDIGFMPGLTAASSKARKRRPKMPKVDMNRAFTKGAAGSSNEQSAQIVRAQLGRGRAGNANLEELKREDVLVVDGSFDHIERVLDALSIRYVKKSPWALTGPSPEDFKSYKIVFWNCGEALTRQRMGTVASRLKTFVRDGGYLFTTDWGVANVLALAFPGYILTTGNRAHLPEMTLPIEPAASARNHPLLEGVFLDGVQGKWWLEQASFDMSVGRKDKVTVLIESQLLQDSFNRSPAVAATFHYGRGRVLHAMGHYYQEAGNLAGTIAAHRLALNFVLLRLAQDKAAR